MKINRSKALVALFGASGAILAGSVQAQQVLEEIVVTAQKRAESMQDVPISISAYTGDALTNLGVDSVSGLTDLTPGLNFEVIGMAASPYLRGVGSNSFTVGSEAPVAVYSDGAYNSNTTATNFYDFLDIERIEVLKGPQGTLFGRNATGGAINIITRQPSEETEGKLEVGFGRYDERSIKGLLSGALNSEAGLYGSIALNLKESDGYITNVNPANGLSDKDVGYSESTSARIKLLWEASDAVTMSLIADTTDATDNSGSAWQPMTDFFVAAEGIFLADGLPTSLAGVSREPHDYAGGSQPLVESESSGLNFTLEWAADFADVKYIASYRETENESFLDADTSPLNIAAFSTSGDVETITHEIQFTSISDGPFQWVAGLFYFDDVSSLGGGDRYPGFSGSGTLVHVGLPFPVTPAELAASMTSANPGTLLHQAGTRSSESYAIYGEGTYDLTDSTRFTLGLRQTEEDLELYDRVNAVIFPNDLSNPTGFVTGIDLLTGEGNETSFSETTWSAVLSHDLTDDSLVYASYKRGFKSGVYALNSPNNTNPTEPENIDAFELGVKSTILDGVMRLNASVFHYKYDNLQVQQLDPLTNAVNTVNAAEAEITGADVSVEWLTTENLSIVANLSILDAEYVEFPDASVTTAFPFSEVNTDLAGFALPRAAEYAANVSANYFVPLDENGELAFNVNWSITDDLVVNQGGNAGDSFIIDGYDKISASVTWNSPNEQYYVRLWGNNLTDEIVPSCNANLAFGYVCTYLPGATYGVTAGVNF